MFARLPTHLISDAPVTAQFENSVSSIIIISASLAHIAVALGTAANAHEPVCSSPQVTRKVDFDSVGTGIGGIVAGGGDVVGEATGGAVAGTMVGDDVAPAPPTMLSFAFGSFSFLVRKEKITANDVLMTATNTSKIAAINMKKRRLPAPELPPPLSLLSRSTQSVTSCTCNSLASLAKRIRDIYIERIRAMTRGKMMS
jgi:hypothetical protein